MPTGHLVYAVGGTLLAVPFDLDRQAVKGAPVSVVEGVRRADASSTGGAHYSFASNGTLVYIAGPLSPRLDVALTDRKGSVERLGLPPHLYEAPRVSPDGTRIAVGTDDGGEAVIWMYRLSGGAAIQRVTFGGNNRFPVWSSNGKRLAFQSDREGDRGIFWQPADGTGTAERLTTPGQDETHEPEAWSPTGNDVLLFSITKGTDVTLWTLSLKDRKTRPFGDVHSSTRLGAVFSPDGRWVAYARSEGRQKTIYIQSFPATETKYQIAANESEQPNHPLWSRDGKELFYNPGPGDFASVSVMTQPTFAFGKTTRLVRPFRGARTGDSTAVPTSPRTADSSLRSRMNLPAAAGSRPRRPVWSSTGSTSSERECRPRSRWSIRLRRHCGKARGPCRDWPQATVGQRAILTCSIECRRLMAGDVFR